MHTKHNCTKTKEKNKLEMFTKHRGVIQIFLQYFWMTCVTLIQQRGPLVFGFSFYRIFLRIIQQYKTQLYTHHTLCIIFAKLEFFRFRSCAWGVSVLFKVKKKRFQSFHSFFGKYLHSVMSFISERLVVAIRYMIFEEIDFFLSDQRPNTRRSNRGRRPVWWT